jgi:hypothetical protein
MEEMKEKAREVGASVKLIEVINNINQSWRA